jgi:hypothetical protein
MAQVEGPSTSVNSRLAEAEVVISSTYVLVKRLINRLEPILNSSVPVPELLTGSCICEPGQDEAPRDINVSPLSFELNKVVISIRSVNELLNSIDINLDLESK